MRITGSFMSLSALLAASSALANPLICTNNDLSRRIEVVYAVPGQALPCEVIYDKSAEGTIESLWQADFDPGYCEARAAGLAEKLSNTGWDCTSSANPDEPTPAEG